jgi:hypothetical protein
METIDKGKIKTQEQTDEPAAMDKANDRVEAEMKLIESKAKEQVAQGLQDEKIARDAERLRQEAEKELDKLADAAQ